MLSVLALCLVLPFAQASGPASSGDVELLDGLVRAAMEQPGAVGLSVAVGRGDELLFARGYGRAELEFGAAADEATMFRIGSVTKQFTAAAILKLAERGQLALDESLTTYLPDYPTHGHEITLRHLLTHTSGVHNYTDLGSTWAAVQPFELSDAELVALWRELPLDFPPGEGWNYSNSGYYLLGMVIAKVTGKSYPEFLREAFFEPLGLTGTRYDSNGEVIPRRAQGYGWQAGRSWNDRVLGMSQPGAAGGLLSTAGDLVRWQQALVAGRVVSSESYLEMTTPYMLASGRETGYGMGLQLDTQLDRPCVWHGGGIHGFNSVLLYFPEERLSVAAISNSEGLRAVPLGFELARALLTRK